MKFAVAVTVSVCVVSPPSRAAWIEIYDLRAKGHKIRSRRLHGRRGLKWTAIQPDMGTRRRRLHGRRGLKCTPKIVIVVPVGSRRLHGRRGLK